MVERVTAFKASDDSVWGTYVEAARHDTKLALKAMGIFTEGTLIAILQNATAVRDALDPMTRVTDALPKASSDAKS